MAGRVEGIYISAERGELPEPVESVRALAGRGLEGNRYFFESDAPPGVALTLIAAEAVEAMEREHGISIEPRESRRNVVTRGIDVNELVGKRFRVGDVECRGVQLCEPCTTLEAMTTQGVIKGLAHRGGLNADILSDGQIGVGAAVVVANGARLALFPEAFIPVYPSSRWARHLAGWEDDARPLYGRLARESLTIPGPDSDRLADIARAHGP